jgi:hypothetical protein
MIRRWCRHYAEGLAFEGDYQQWVVEKFSGTLCINEDYQDKPRKQKPGLLVESPIGEEVRLLRGFLEEWYLLFYDEQHDRRTLVETKERYYPLKSNPYYLTLEHVAGLPVRYCEEHFQEVSCFLEHEETNKTGSRKMGRTARHLQRSRYNVGEPASIEAASRPRT